LRALHGQVRPCNALLAELGYFIVAIAERLGDAVEVAISTYSHLYPDKMQVIAADLDWQAREKIPAASQEDASLAGAADPLETAEKRLLQVKRYVSGAPQKKCAVLQHKIELPILFGQYKKEARVGNMKF